MPSIQSIATHNWDNHALLNDVWRAYPSRDSQAKLRRAERAAREALSNSVVVYAILSHYTRPVAERLWSVSRVWFQEIKRIRSQLLPCKPLHETNYTFIGRRLFWPLLCSSDHRFELETNNKQDKQDKQAKQAKLHPKRIHMPRRLPVPRAPQRGRRRKHR
jgi:hypothetical protein